MEIKIEGYHKNHRYVRLNQSAAGINIPYTLDGNYLDEIQITARIQSEKDIDELIKLLDYSRECFKHPMRYEPPV